jgi:hypothetical protein
LTLEFKMKDKTVKIGPVRVVGIYGREEGE